jgi:hypothetical protein
MSETEKRGGPRNGAGLAADAGGVKTKKHTVTLDAFTVAFLELLGNGNLSRGIREAARKLAPKKTMKTGETHEHWTPNAALTGLSG